MNEEPPIFFDAGIFIGALLKKDPRHEEARCIVESARRGLISAVTTTSILSEVFAALTWINAQPPHSSNDAASVVRLLVDPPSAIQVISDGLDACRIMLDLVAKYNLTARRVHDARHAATAISNGVKAIYTYDIADWKAFEEDGLTIVGPPSIMS